MRIRTIGLAALMAGPLMIGGSYAQQTLEDEIQQEEAPGSAIETEISPGRVIIGRQRNLNPSPVEIQGQTLDAPDDPDTPMAEDPVDAELPGEGPEDRSGPDDDDSLPD
jgi:hypothetical protein